MYLSVMSDPNERNMRSHSNAGPLVRPTLSQDSVRKSANDINLLIARTEKKSKLYKDDRNDDNLISNEAVEDSSSEFSKLSRRPRKKRKVFSCETCRKFKTRCDFEPLVGKCHRCNVLHIQCSLTKDRENEIISAIEYSTKPAITLNDFDSNVSDTLPEMSTSINSNKTHTTIRKDNNKPIGQEFVHDHPLTYNLNQRLEKLEDKFSSLNSKIDLILLLMQGSSSATSNAREMLTNPNNFEYENESVESHDESNELSRNNIIEKNNKASIVNDTGYASESSISDLPIHGYNESISDYSNTMPSNTRQTGYTQIYKLKEYPFKIINDIDERLFPLVATSKQEMIQREQRPSAVARVNFLLFYERHKALCQALSKEFLVRSHFWIIPGGLKEFNEEFIRSHLFITSVTTIIAMSSSDNEKYGEIQETLYPLVERLLTNTLTMFDKLTVHDIEAILYCCMFHISKKAKRHRQLKFNAMVLANFALFSLMNNVDFYKIKERVLVDEVYDANDIYHLRVLNSLTACHLQYSIAHGSMATQNKLFKEFNNLIAKFPQANFGDDIKLSEINLGDIVTTIFIDFKNYFNRYLEFFLKQPPISEGANRKQKRILIFPELNYWLNNWEELLAKDGGGVLLFTYDFYHIMICRSFLTEFQERINKHPEFLNSIAYTMKEHAFSLLKGFLRLPPSLIKGAPILTTNELVYACLTLSDHLNWFKPNEKQEILSICTRVYWHLNTIGEKMNEVTDSVGKIIKYIITTAKGRVNIGPYAPSIIDIPDFISKTPELNPVVILSSSENNNSTVSIQKSEIQTPVRPVDVNVASRQTENIIGINSSISDPRDRNDKVGLDISKKQQNSKGSSKNVSSVSIPDVDQFNSFEDFFQEFFDHLKPATRKMFTSNK